MVKISFLIPVYNQPLELRECISRIVEYKGNNIEIVVSDDNSTEDLKKIVDVFGDNRIKLYRNSENLGLDGNMLFGMSRCKGEFVFLLRTRDFIISDSIPRIISVIDEYPDVAYITGTCLDDDGLPRRLFKEGLYKKGEEAFEAHDNAHFHPSGSAFKRELIDIELIKKYLDSSGERRIWFMADQLIRLHLATKGDFYFIERPIWIYTYTERNTKPSVHRKANDSIYAPQYTYKRFKSEMLFISNEIEEYFKTQRFCKCFEFWLMQATWRYLELATDKKLQEHYGNSNVNVDIDLERKNFINFSCEIEKELELDERYNMVKKNVIADNINFEEEYIRKKERIEYVETISKEILEIIEKNKSCNKNLDELLSSDGYTTVGIYGAGYLGKKIWNELINSKMIKVKYLCDKLYWDVLPLQNGVVAVPPKAIEDYSVDICLITPVQSVKEIKQEIAKRVNGISIQDYLLSHRR